MNISPEIADLLFDDLDKEGAKKDPKERKALQARELKMWEAWKADPTPAKLDPLMKSLAPIINRQTTRYRVPAIPVAAMEAEVKLRVVKALGRYDPAQAKLSTYLDHSLRSVGRFQKKYQNIGKIPEPRTYKIGEFQRAKAVLRDRFGREPTMLELSEELKWPWNEVQLLETELRDDLIGSEFMSDPITFEPSRSGDVLQFIYYELTSDEKAVYEYVEGAYGKPQLGTTEIARKLGMTPAKVSRIKARIADKIEKHL